MQVGWGQISMVDAEKRLLANALQDADNQHFVLLSDRFCSKWHDQVHVVVYMCTYILINIFSNLSLFAAVSHCRILILCIDILWKPTLALLTGEPISFRVKLA